MIDRPRRLVGYWCAPQFALVTFVVLLVGTQAGWVVVANGSLGETPGWVGAARGAGFALLSLAIVGRTLSRGGSEFGWTAIMLATLGFYVILNNTASGSIGSSASFITSYFVLAIFSAVVAGRLLAPSQLLITCLRLVVWGSVVFGVLVPQYAFLAGGVRFGLLAVEGRLTGVVGDANTLSFFAVFLLLVSLWAKARGRSIDLLAVTFVVVFGQSRFGLLAAFAVLVVVIWRDRSALIARLLFVASSIFSLIPLLIWDNTVSDEATLGQDVFNSRPLIWQWSFAIWRSSPLTGVGLEQYYELVTDKSGFWVHSHNQLLQELVLGGVIGAALFIGLVAVLSARALSLLKRLANPVPLMAVTLLLMFSAVEVPMFVDSPNFRLLSVFLVLLAFGGNGRLGAVLTSSIKSISSAQSPNGRMGRPAAKGR